MLRIDAVTYRIAGRLLLEEASATIPPKAKIGLVGRNGSGKTTLFRLILGESAVDGGTITRPTRSTLAAVAQEAPGGAATPLQTVLSADQELTALSAEAEQEDLSPDRIAEVHARLAEIEAHSAEARASAILAGLGFDSAQRQRPLSDFSGGWRMRVALAATLFQRPDYLLLDEPTNHLDLEATVWLENYLLNFPGSLLIISHERRLLNRVANGILHLEGAKLVAYGGNYDTFERTRREKLLLQGKMRERQLAERARIQDFVDRFRAKATKARQAQSRIKMLERMEPVTAVIEEHAPRFSFPNPDPLPPPVIALENGAVGYVPGTPVLQRLNLRLDMDDRIGLLGANGNGKSTLIRLMAGALKPESGDFRRPDKLRVAYFAQHQMESLEPTSTPYQTLAAALPDETEPRVRARLGPFGFDKTRADTPVRDLSGGEKARLVLALLSRFAPHLLLLDEPTNHLDVDARDALIQALNAFTGAVILVSHDAHLVEAVCDRLWLVDDGTCTVFDGDLADYEKQLLSRRRGGDSGTSDRSEAATKKDARRNRAESRAKLAPLRDAARKADKALEKLTAQRAALEARLAEPSLYDGPAEAVSDLQRELGQLDKDIATVEETWMAAHEALEAASETD